MELGGPGLRLHTRAWAEGERIQDQLLYLFDDNQDRVLDRHDRIYSSNVRVRSLKVSNGLGGAMGRFGNPRVYLTRSGPEVRGLFGAAKVGLHARRSFGIAMPPPGENPGG
jgi:hypothetical protein